jgi:transposase
METIYFLGIDVSKKKLDTALTVNGKNFHFDQAGNNPSDVRHYFKELRKKIASFGNLIVCIEHTGIYSQPLLDVIVKLKIQVCVEPAQRIKLSQGMTRGKNDQVDAKRIAHYAYKNYKELVFWNPQRESIQQLKALLVLRERMINVKTQLEVPLSECEEFVDSTIQKTLIRHCKKSLRVMRSEIKDLEKSIDQLIDKDQSLAHQFTLATSVPGIGKITAANVIISTGEFKQIVEAKQFACYSGIAPFEHTSGSSIRGQTRVSKIANMRIKKLLHLAAMSAIQSDEELRSYYLRKVEGGKNKMSVLNAVRNKLISRVFACIKNDHIYQKKYQNELA